MHQTKTLGIRDGSLVVTKAPNHVPVLGNISHAKPSPISAAVHNYRGGTESRIGEMTRGVQH